ncbi:hypothetical protein [Psychromonas sp.]|uniref:hypothetical protein n=1 Tax=Psychromonas sp. TaxID=1884585 RepID=UPI003568046D
MRKKIIKLDQKQDVDSSRKWLDIEKLAAVEVTSEDDAFPIESALLPGKVSEWCALEPGKQMIRLRFDDPQRIQWIRLNFQEPEIIRTQEFILRWSNDGGLSYREIIRQQWNFSPEGSTSEIENYQVDLSGVTILELSINPDISGTNALASLKELRLA